MLWNPENSEEIPKEQLQETVTAAGPATGTTDNPVANILDGARKASVATLDLVGVAARKVSKTLEGVDTDVAADRVTLLANAAGDRATGLATAAAVAAVNLAKEEERRSSAKRRSKSSLVRRSTKSSKNKLSTIHCHQEESGITTDDGRGTNESKTSVEGTAEGESVDSVIDSVEDDATEKLKMMIIAAVIAAIILIPCVCKFCCNTWYYRRCGPPESCRSCCSCCGLCSCCYAAEAKDGYCNGCALNCCDPDGKCGGWGLLC